MPILLRSSGDFFERDVGAAIFAAQEDGFFTEEEQREVDERLARELVEERERESELVRVEMEEVRVGRHNRRIADNVNEIVTGYV